MPPGRTGGGYTAPTLTEEEAAALAAEQAAAYGSDYAPTEPPPAEPVEQTTMYQPSSPPPAAAPTMTQVVPVGSGEVPDIQGQGQTPPGMGDAAAYQPAAPPPSAYTSISPQVTQTSNPRFVPGMTRTPADAYDDAAHMPGAGGGRDWSSISPQVNDSQFALTPSDARDPLQGGKTIPYQPREMATANAQFDAQQARESNRAGAPSGGFHGPGSGLSTVAANQRPNTQGRGTLRVGTLDEAGQQVASDVLGLDQNPNRPSPTGMPKAGIAGGLSSLYAGEVEPSQDEGAGYGGSVGDMVARSFGLNPDDPKDNLYQQFVNSMYRQGGDVLGHSIRGAGDILGGTAKIGANVLGMTLRNEQRRWLDPLLNIDDTGSGLWNAAEAIIGPHGTGLRQVQSTFDPLGTGIAERVTDPLGAAKDAVGAAKDDFFNFAGATKDAAVSGAQRTADQAATTTADVTNGRRSLGDALLDAMNYPLPSLGLPTPQPRDIDLSDPEWSWLLTPGAVAREAGLELGQEGRRLVDEAKMRGDQVARGSNLRARLANAPTLDDAMTAVRSIDLPSVRLPESLGAYVPGDPGQSRVDPALMQQARDAANAAKAWAVGLDLPDVTLPTPGGERYTPRLPDGVIQGITDRLPDVNLPDINLPGGAEPMRGVVGGGIAPNVGNGGAPLTIRRTGPEGIDPNALYMPLPPEPSILDRARSAGSDVVQGITDRLPDVTLPGATLPNVDLPDISLPGRGTPRGGPGTGGRSAGATPATDPLQQVFTEQQSGATRTATQPEGTSLAQEAGADWIKDANGNYVGLVDPNTGEYVMLPANATNEEKQAIVNGILSATPSNPAPGPATATQSASPTATTTGTSTGSPNSGSSTSETRSNGTSGGSGSSGTSTGRKSRSSDTSYDDDGEDTPLKLEDFIQDFDGDGVISKRDRMQGKKAFEQAKMARSKQRRGKTTRKNSAKNFPFNDRRSALGQQIARDVADALAGKG